MSAIALYDKELTSLRAEYAKMSESAQISERELAALRLENASHLATIDALTRTALNASDSRAAHQLAVGVRAVHAMLRNVTGKVALGVDERPWVDAVKAWLVTNGISVYEDVQQ